MANVFGFPDKPANGGAFVPIVKYDARAGRMFRVDRINTGNGFEREDIDITDGFRAMFDFENLEVGFMCFKPGIAPDMQVVPMGTKLPAQPSADHDYGIRVMLKLTKDVGGEEPIREMAGTSQAFKSGMEAAYLAYQAGKDANAGKLPVFALDKTMPVKSGSGAKSSTNYHPSFKLVGWAPRGDLEFVPKATAVAVPVSTTPPSTGSTVATKPVGRTAEAVSVDDFG